MNSFWNIIILYIFFKNLSTLNEKLLIQQKMNEISTTIFKIPRHLSNLAEIFQCYMKFHKGNYAMRLLTFIITWFFRKSFAIHRNFIFKKVLNEWLIHSQLTVFGIYRVHMDIYFIICSDIQVRRSYTRKVKFKIANN